MLGSVAGAHGEDAQCTTSHENARTFDIEREKWRWTGDAGALIKEVAGILGVSVQDRAHCPQENALHVYMVKAPTHRRGKAAKSW